jgi:hypothetical protein
MVLWQVIQVLHGAKPAPGERAVSCTASRAWRVGRIYRGSVVLNEDVGRGETRADDANGKL